MGDEGVEERSETFVSATIESLVVVANVLFSKAFENENHHVLGFELHGISRDVDRREVVFHFLLSHIVGGDKRSLVERANNGKWRVEYDACFACLVHVLVGIADGDGACG